MKKFLSYFGSVFLVLFFAFVFVYAGFSIGRGSSYTAQEDPTVDASPLANEKTPSSQDKAKTPSPQGGTKTPSPQEEPKSPSYDEKSTFKKFTLEVFNTLSAEEMRNAIEELTYIISGYLEIENVPTVVYNLEGLNKDFNYLGTYNRRYNRVTLYINRLLLSYKDPYKIIEVLAHEIRHAAQYDMADSGVESLLTYSIQNYIQPGENGENFKNYYNQPAEVDARGYGEFFAEYVKSINKSS